MDYCRKILHKMPVDAFLLTSDKVHFHLCGTVNKQNTSYWTLEILHSFIKVHFYTVKKTLFGSQFSVLESLAFIFSKREAKQ